MNAKSGKNATETTEQSREPNERHFVFADSFDESSIRRASDVYVEVTQPHEDSPTLKGMVRLVFVSRRGKRVQYTLSSFAGIKLGAVLKNAGVA